MNRLRCDSGVGGGRGGGRGCRRRGGVGGGDCRKAEVCRADVVELDEVAPLVLELNAAA